MKIKRMNGRDISIAAGVLKTKKNGPQNSRAIFFSAERTIILRFFLSFFFFFSFQTPHSLLQFLYSVTVM